MRRTMVAGCRVSLALVFLLATSTPRMSMTHSHPTDEAASDDDHPHHVRVHDHEAVIVRSEDPHTHVRWFGFEFEVPAESGNQQCPLEDHSDWQVEQSVGAAISTVPLLIPNLLFSSSMLAFDQFIRIDTTIDANRWAHRSPDSPRMLLCDTARRECAGVLLV